jgi:hypothetical protein
MIDKEQLKKMIKSQEEAIKKLTEQLNELKAVARENGIVEEPTNFADFSNNSKISSEVEKKRQEIFNSIQKVREEAQVAAKKAMEDAKNNISSSLNSMNNFSNESLMQRLSSVPLPKPSSCLPIDFLKERNTINSDDKLKKIMEDLKEKKKNQIKDVLVSSGTPQVIESVPEVVEVSDIVEENK